MRSNDEYCFAGRNSLHWAAYGGHVEVMRLLKERGCDLNALTDDKATALHLAADNDNIAAVRWLVRNGVNIHAKNSKCLRALDLAQDMGDTEMIGYLRCKEKEVCVKNEFTLGNITSMAVVPYLGWKILIVQR